jgi:hypothetical protein
MERDPNDSVGGFTAGFGKRLDVREGGNRLVGVEELDSPEAELLDVPLSSAAMTTVAGWAEKKAEDSELSSTRTPESEGNDDREVEVDVWEMSLFDA